MKKETNYQGQEEHQDGKCCVAGARNENEEYQISAAECQWGLMSIRISGGLLKSGGGGVRSA